MTTPVGGCRSRGAASPPRVPLSWCRECRCSRCIPPPNKQSAPCIVAATRTSRCRNLISISLCNLTGEISFRELHKLLRRTKASDEDRKRRWAKKGKAKIADFEDIRKEVAASVCMLSIQTQFNAREKRVSKEYSQEEGEEGLGTEEKP